MPITYEKAKADVQALINQVIADYHEDLKEYEVRVSAVMARNVSDDGLVLPAVKLNGYPCAATVRIISYKNRVCGLPDAQITIDEDTWNAAPEETRIALLDHELTHLEVSKDADGCVRTDDAGRPKLTTRLHDHQFGWFGEVAKRHGDASYEVQQAKAFANLNGPLFFGWPAPSGAVEEGPAKTTGDDIFGGESTGTSTVTNDGLPDGSKKELRDAIKSKLTAAAGKDAV